MSSPARLIVVMGVSGSGKSTVGEALARKLGTEFLDGDGYHPPANKQKMRAGIPLTDADRWPWLKILVDVMKESAEKNGTVVAACSALRRIYRDFMTKEAGEPVTFIHLAGSKELILSRISVRKHEYMPVTLLDSQFATLEPPEADENAISVPIDQTVEEIADAAAKALELRAKK